MCEYNDKGYPIGTCKPKGSFWVQGPNGNLIVCGRHLSLTVKKVATGGKETTVKIRYPGPYGRDRWK